MEADGEGAVHTLHHEAADGGRFNVCVLKEGQDVSKDDLHTWCRDNMANYKVPRYITFVDALPLNATGKVQKFKLRDKL